jgi:hypothetical protein
MGASPEIAAKFYECVAQFESATGAAIKISESNIGIYHTGRQNRALFLFAKMIAHDISMWVIIDRYIKLRKRRDRASLDHFSVASLTRMIVDASLMTMYISHPSLNRDAWNLRRYVLYLHDLTNRKRFLVTVKHTDEEYFKIYPDRKDKLINKIVMFAKSLNVSENDTADLIKGQKVFVSGARGAVREAGWDVEQFDFIQSYLSPFVHSYPISFMRADEQKISFQDPSDFQLNLCTLAVVIAADYTERVTQRMTAFSVTGTGDPLGQVDD